MFKKRFKFCTNFRKYQFSKKNKQSYKFLNVWLRTLVQFLFPTILHHSMLFNDLNIKDYCFKFLIKSDCKLKFTFSQGTTYTVLQHSRGLKWCRGSKSGLPTLGTILQPSGLEVKLVHCLLTTRLVLDALLMATTNRMYSIH